MCVERRNFERLTYFYAGKIKFQTVNKGYPCHGNKISENFSHYRIELNLCSGDQNMHSFLFSQPIQTYHYMYEYQNLFGVVILRFFLFCIY
jgi:hypothetical protein